MTRIFRHLAGALRHSLHGLAAAYRDELAFRLEVWLAAPLILLACLLDIGYGARALLITVTLLPLVAELLNTALEAAIDLTMPTRHPLAKKAKDCGSAAVWLALFVAGAVWLMILFPYWLQP